MAAGGGPHGMRPTDANRPCRTRTPAVRTGSVGGTPRSDPSRPEVGRRFPRVRGTMAFPSVTPPAGAPRRMRTRGSRPEERAPEDAARPARRAGSRDDGGSGRGVGGDGRPTGGGPAANEPSAWTGSRPARRTTPPIPGAAPGFRLPAGCGTGSFRRRNDLRRECPARGGRTGAARRQSASASPKGARKTGPDLAARSLAGCGEDRRLRIRYDSGRRRGPEGVAGALPVPFPGDTPHDADHRRAGPALRPDAASRAPRQ